MVSAGARMNFINFTFIETFYSASKVKNQKKFEFCGSKIVFTMSKKNFI